MLKRSIVLSLSAGGALSNLLAAREHGRPDSWAGSPDVFPGVPDHDLDVILARPTLTSVTLSVAAARDITAALSYQPGAIPRILRLEAGVPQEVEITGLSPNRSYRYTIAAGAPLTTGTFRTARTAGEPFTFAVQTDSHVDGNGDARLYTNTLTNIL